MIHKKGLARTSLKDTTQEISQIQKKTPYKFGAFKKKPYLCTAIPKEEWRDSSAG